MKKAEARWLAGIGVVLQFLLGSSFALGQVVGETKTIEITVDDPRPLAAAVLKIEELSGIPINYEDVPVYYTADVKDVTEEVSRTRTSNRRILVALGGQLSVPIVVDAVTGKLNDTQAVNAALLALISAYSVSGLPGSFDLEYYNGVFFVKPVRFRDETGATRAMTPVLSTPITLPEENMNWAVATRLILQQVSNATGSDAAMLTNLGVPVEVTFGANNEPAHYVIARYLATKSAPASIASDTAWDAGLSYSLLYQPQFGYGLNVHRVASSPRWVIPPSRPYSPPPRRPPDGRGTARVPVP